NNFIDRVCLPRIISHTSAKKSSFGLLTERRQAAWLKDNGFITAPAYAHARVTGSAYFADPRSSSPPLIYPNLPEVFAPPILNKSTGPFSFSLIDLWFRSLLACESPVCHPN